VNEGSVAVRPREGIAHLARDARWELMMLDPGTAEFRSLAVTSAARGIVVRSAVPNRTLLAPMAAAEVGRCVDRGVRVRAVAAVPAGMVIVDRRLVVVQDDDDSAHVVLSDRGSVALLSELFERTWADGLPFGHSRRRLSRPVQHSGRRLSRPVQHSGRRLSRPVQDSGRRLSRPVQDSGRRLSRPVQDSRRRLSRPVQDSRRRLSQPMQHSAPGLTGLQAAAVQLLAAGHTDDAIARRLGVSPRTARRIANTLMARLGARGRFQAGVHAVRAGWLA
jgi:DNA-binding CsgD family transcriptional regulator